MKNKKVILQSDLGDEFKDLNHKYGLHPIFDRDDSDSVVITREVLVRAIDANKHLFDNLPEVKLLADKLIKLFDEFNIDLLIRDVGLDGGLMLQKDNQFIF